MNSASRVRSLVGRMAADAGAAMASDDGDTFRGPDGLDRCRWCAGDDGYRVYHDSEWGLPVVDDRRLFEKLCLEGFQAGLSWLTILRKRPAFRRAFADFDVDQIATYGERDIERLLADAAIIRHRGKIEATIARNEGARSTGPDYPSADGLINDLRVLEQGLADAKCASLATDLVRPVRRMVEIFRFSTVRLDLRERRGDRGVVGHVDVDEARADLLGSGSPASLVAGADVDRVSGGDQLSCGLLAETRVRPGDLSRRHGPTFGGPHTSSQTSACRRTVRARTPVCRPRVSRARVDPPHGSGMPATPLAARRARRGSRPACDARRSAR